MRRMSWGYSRSDVLDNLIIQIIVMWIFMGELIQINLIAIIRLSSQMFSALKKI